MQSSGSAIARAASAAPVDPGPRWPLVYARLQHTEGGDRPNGGFNDIAGDRGGATKYGLSLRFLAATCALNPALKARLDADNNGAIDRFDVLNLSASNAEEVYCDYFWTRPGFYSLPAPFDAAMFDQGVNAGNQAAVKLLQLSCNAVAADLRLRSTPLAVDGVLGPGTRGRLADLISRLGTTPVLAALRKATSTRYVEIAAADPSQRKFIGGWLRRAEELGDV